MRRTAAALALLLATAPVAGATEITPETKPEIRVVEGTAPAIRQDLAIAPAHADTRSTKAARAAQMDRESWTIVLVALAVIAVTLLFF